MNKLVIISNKKSVSFFDTKEKRTIWTKEMEKKILNTYRVGDYVFIYTYTNWGYTYTSLVDINGGNFLWKDKYLESVSNTLLYKNHLYFIDKSFNIISIVLKTGKEVFKKKFPYKKWYSSVYPKLVVYDNQVVVYNKKNAVKINVLNNDFDDFIFRSHELKEILIMNDLYNIHVNSYVTSDGGYVVAYGGDGGGAGGGDGGGAGGGDGGGG